MPPLLRYGGIMKTISIDVETFSSADLSKCGVYKYAEAQDFEILLFGYSVDGGAVQVVDFAAGETLPPEILDALTDRSVQKWAFNANSGTAPGIVDSACETIIERSQIYSGVYARASVNFFAFNSNGNKGIACGLNNIQKLRAGDPLGGKSRAEDDFATDDDDDFLS